MGLVHPGSGRVLARREAAQQAEQRRQDSRGFLRTQYERREVKIGVAGCGHWGKNHVRIFKELGVLWAVVDPTEEGRDRACVVAPNAKLFSDFAGDVASCKGINHQIAGLGKKLDEKLRQGMRKSRWVRFESMLTTFTQIGAV